MYTSFRYRSGITAMHWAYMEVSVSTIHKGKRKQQQQEMKGLTDGLTTAQTPLKIRLTKPPLPRL